MLPSGVRVAVQVMLSDVLRLLRVPLATLKSAVVRPVTASLKVTVTVVLWPAFSVLSAIWMTAVGRWVSMT
ncbi:hypothetical protein D3C77_725310 [compost metagenome]